MSLNVYVDHIREDLRYNEDKSEIGFKAKNIGFWSIAIEIGRLDEQHIEEWFARYLVLRSMGVNFFVDVVGDPVEISYQDLVDHLGLTTNVITRTRFSWLKNQVGGRMDDGKRDRKRATKLRDHDSPFSEAGPHGEDLSTE